MEGWPGDTLTLTLYTHTHVPWGFSIPLFITTCGKFGHERADCYGNKRKAKFQVSSGKYPKRSKGDEANIAEEAEDKHIIF